MKRFALLWSFLAIAGAVPAGDLIGTCKVVEDGDTIIISAGGLEHTITLYGVQAPEINQDYGLEAKRQAEALALGRRVKVIDKGQGAGVVIVQGGAVLNSELVKAGCAWSDPQEGDIAVLTLEATARAAKVGLWAAPIQITPWDFRKRMAKLQDETRAKSSAAPSPENESRNVHILGEDASRNSPMFQVVAAERQRQTAAEEERIRRASMPKVYRAYLDPWYDDARVTSRAGDSIEDLQFRGARRTVYEWLGWDRPVYYASPGAIRSQSGYYSTQRNLYRLKNQIETMKR